VNKIVYCLVCLMILSNVLIVTWVNKKLNSMAQHAMYITQLASAERDILLRICKLELGTSMAELTETYQAYIAVIQDAVPPDHILKYAEILELDIARHKSLMKALESMTTLR